MPVWFWTTLSWVFLAAAVAAFGYLVVWGDRAKGRKRCPKRWYDMAEHVEAFEGPWECPECGKICSNRLSLHRTRRRFRLAAVCSFAGLVAAFASAVTPDVARRGLVAAIPTPFLVLLIDENMYLAEYVSLLAVTPDGEWDVSALEAELNAKVRHRSGWRSQLLLHRLRAASDAKGVSIYTSRQVLLLGTALGQKRLPDFQEFLGVDEDNHKLIAAELFRMAGFSDDGWDEQDATAYSIGIFAGRRGVDVSAARHAGLVFIEASPDVLRATNSAIAKADRIGLHPRFSREEGQWFVPDRP